MYGCDPWKDKEDAIERRLDQLEGRNIDHDQALLDLQVEVDNDRAAMEAYASAMLTGDAFNDVMLVVSNELETKIPISDKGVPEGVATLDVSGKVPSSQIPAVPAALQTFTNSALGGIKGSATAGRISANADGTGSVNGWDTKANVNGQVFTGNIEISKPTEGIFYFNRQKDINDTWGRFMWIRVNGLLNGINKQIGEILHTHSKVNDTNYTTTLGLNLTTNYNNVDHTHYTGPRMHIVNGVPERYFIFETRVNSQSTDGVNYSQLLSAQSDTITTIANTYVRADAVGAVNGIAGLDATGKVPTGQLPARGISDVTGLQTALDGKVASNTPITAGTKSKITYDSKGLVTAGAYLAPGDIPDLDASKIKSGTIADARIPALAISKITGLQTALDGKQGMFSLYEHTIRVWTSVASDKFRFSLTVLNQSATPFTLPTLKEYLGSSVGDYKQCTGTVLTQIPARLKILTGVRGGAPNQLYFEGVDTTTGAIENFWVDWMEVEVLYADKVRQIV